MARQYKMVRMPLETFNRYDNIKKQMESDLKRFTGKNIRMTRPHVYDAFVNPQTNKRLVEINLPDLLNLVKPKKGRRN